MPWKKNFNMEDALENAMQVFWQKGYEATSISDIINATGVQRQSLYNAFGGKQELFVAALLKFDTERRKIVLGEFEARETPLSSIREIFDLAVDDPLKRGCFMVNTALEIQGHEEEVLQIITEGVEQFRSFYKRLIEKGQELGEIPLRVNASAAASALLATLFGMRVMGRGTVEKETLRQVANQAMQIIS